MLSSPFAVASSFGFAAPEVEDDTIPSVLYGKGNGSLHTSTHQGEKPKLSSTCGRHGCKNLLFIHSLSL